MRLLAAAAALGLAAMLAAPPAAANPFEAMTVEEREAFRAEVRAYLLENPEVLEEAIAVLEERQAQLPGRGRHRTGRGQCRGAVRRSGSWVGGNPEGDITVVEFIDYRCGYCRRAYEEVEELVATDGNIRFVIKEFPILGPQSLTASQLAVAALQTGGPDAYKQVHDALMTWPGDIGPAAVARIAADAGLDPEAIAAAMESDAVNQVIEANHALAMRLRITGTPTFVIGDEMVRGYHAACRHAGRRSPRWPAPRRRTARTASGRFSIRIAGGYNARQRIRTRGRTPHGQRSFAGQRRGVHRGAGKTLARARSDRDSRSIGALAPTTRWAFASRAGPKWGPAPRRRSPRCRRRPPRRPPRRTCPRPGRGRSGADGWRGDLAHGRHRLSAGRTGRAALRQGSAMRWKRGRRC
jgi:protein-disulfide isomerase